MKPLLESTTAVKHGWGCMPTRWVSHLTPTEREAVRKRTATVWFHIPQVWFHPQSGKPHHTQSGFKVVKLSGARNERFDAREPTAAELQEIQKASGRG